EVSEVDLNLNSFRALGFCYDRPSRHFRQLIAVRPIAGFAPGVLLWKRMPRIERAIVGNVFNANPKFIYSIGKFARDKKLRFPPPTIARNVIVFGRRKFRFGEVLAIGSAVDAGVTSGVVPIADVLPLSISTGRFY